MQESNTDSYSCCTFAFPPPPLFLKKEHFIAPPSRGKEFSIERERSVIFNKVLGSAHQAKPLAV